ncbi:MAG: large conductance mechanosensitive channel protein MscL [Candidatus Doudnabacteria bacterium]
MLKDFKAFLFRGNVVDLAVGVVIGAAFGGVVTSLVEDLLTPLISAIAKLPDFSSLSLTINDVSLNYGLFLNAVISFVMVAAAIYFFVIMPMTKVMSMGKKPEAGPTTKDCGECKSEVPMDAKRCKYCAQPMA